MAVLKQISKDKVGSKAVLGSLTLTVLHQMRMSLRCWLWCCHRTTVTPPYGKKQAQRHFISSVCVVLEVKRRMITPMSLLLGGRRRIVPIVLQWHESATSRTMNTTESDD